LGPCPRGGLAAARAAMGRSVGVTRGVLLAEPPGLPVPGRIIENTPEYGRSPAVKAPPALSALEVERVAAAAALVRERMLPQRSDPGKGGVVASIAPPGECLYCDRRRAINAVSAGKRRKRLREKKG
jgi:hypothetical protein